jgi:hypothetical protein
MEVGLNATLLRRGFSHRIDTRPEETLLCVLAWENIQKILRAMMPSWSAHAGWRHMMVYFHVSTRKISDKILSE